MNLARVDLNLLLVFDAVMAERNVTRAGRRIGLTQSAVSNALSRLRHLLEDELFVRGPEGMRPTPRALELSVPVRQALEQIQAALDPAQFVPGEATRSFNLAMTDYAASLILPRLAEHLGATAPGVDIRVRVNTIVNAPAMLDAGEIDFAVGGAPDAPSRFGRFALMEDDYVCVMRRGHPLAGPSLALPDYIAARHLLITLTGDATGIVDRLLEPMGLRRRVAMTCNQFQVAPLIIRSSDLIVTLPRRIAETSAMVDELHIVPVPLPVPPIKVMLLWHDRLGNHPAQEWMQAVLAEICRTL